MALVNLSAFEFLDITSTSDRFLTTMHQKSPALITGLLRKTIYKNTSIGGGETSFGISPLALRYPQNAFLRCRQDANQL